MERDLTLVIDIGKSNAKLLFMDAAGQVQAQYSRPNASVTSPLAYPALDVAGLAEWMQSSVRQAPLRQRCGRVIASTHGAAMVALGEESGVSDLAWAPLDYEFEGVQPQGDAQLAAVGAAADSFRATLSPHLPAGLNAARQLDWMQNTHPDAWRRTRCLLPYAQYWAWLLSGVASSEVSSLGCHTHLWQPVAGRFSDWALGRGWAALFAPLRPAWDVLGPVRPAIAATWGLPPNCLVHVGVHDSNACLARYLAVHAPPQATAPLTIVSSGTWTVLMAPGANADSLDAQKDMLGNVSVTGHVTPTARFMGGREFAVLLDGASPDAATDADLRQVRDSGTHAWPSFASQGGPFAGRAGRLTRGGRDVGGPWRQHLHDGQRAALAAIYCAQMTAWLTAYLWAGVCTPGRLIVEGPLAHNRHYLGVLQALLGDTACFYSTDAVEGTARGAWQLAHWTGRPALAAPAPGAYVAPAPRSDASDAAAWCRYHAAWCDGLQPV